MTDLNSVILIGRLTRDVELKYTQSGLAVASGSIAVNRSTKNQNGTYDNKGSFFDFDFMGKMAESLSPYLLKGKQVGLIGRLQQDTWTDRETGAKKSKVKIFVETVQLLGSQSNNQQGNQAGGYSTSGYDANGGYPSDVEF